MGSGDLVIIGLPSSGLHQLAGSFGIRQIDDAEIRRAYDRPDEPGEISAEAMIGRWEEHIDESRSRQGLLIYRTPWGLLERQLRRSASDNRAQLEFVARNALTFWQAYHVALFGLRRRHEGRFLLINGDRPIDVGAAAALVEKTFSVPPALTQDPRASGIFCATRNHEEVFRQIVDELAPECLELYAALESCAQLMGRQPELEFGGLARRQVFLSDVLHLAAREGRIERLLDLHGVDAGEVHARLESVLRARKEHIESEPERRQVLSTLEATLQALQAEVERGVVQVRQLEEKLQSRQAHADGYLEKIQRLDETLRLRQGESEGHLIKARQLEQRLHSHQAEADAQLARSRQLEENLSSANARTDSLKKECELYLLQLHQMQQELEHQFELSQQKERLLADVQQRIEWQTLPLMRKLSRRAVGVKISAGSAISSPARTVAAWFWWARKDARIRRKQMQTIRASGLFDERWYLQRYPDVAHARCDPIAHYLQFGASEARNPSTRFDTRWYLDAYPDVARAGTNPLLHYIEFGKGEGRQPMHFVA